ncbi:AMP-binding protein [Nitriliruptor alkaliphilus]|uniref:AMP-binding protein n=1 Tax=Nitriliruptor alkaliphilus TaxID=427918 RepID=UPI000696632E|nr:AMP-binding protein [Nitriliruptor alkaliphilus]
MSEPPRIHCGSVTRTHDQVRERAARIATGLDDLGVQPGDHVAIVLRNDIAFIEATLAIGSLGAVPVPINWHWSGDETAHLLAHSGSVAALVHSDLVPTVRRARDLPIVEVPVPPDVVDAYELEPDSTVPTGEHPRLDDWATSCEAWSRPAAQAALSTIYTSGTTGAPKGIRREPVDADRNAQNAALVREVLGLAPEHHTLVTMPLYHSAPNAHAMFCLALGMEISVLPRFDAEGMLRLIDERRIDHLQAVPTMFVRLLRLPPSIRATYDLSSLVAVVHAAAPCAPEVKRRMIEWLGPIVHEYYGGTESGVLTACTSDEWLAHPGTVGRPVRDAVIRIVDDRGTQLPAGEVGLVSCKPVSSWPGFTYVGDAPGSSPGDDDGYLTIGDIGHVDEDGYLYLNDRVNDMVISGGVNIYPAEVENCLYGLDGVKDVAVFGVPDEEYGEVLAAHVEVAAEAALTEEDVRAHVAGHLAAYKVPRVVVFDDALPREESGKLFKRRLREQYRTPV